MLWTLEGQRRSLNPEDWNFYQLLSKNGKREVRSSGNLETLNGKQEAGSKKEEVRSCVKREAKDQEPASWRQEKGSKSRGSEKHEATGSWDEKQEATGSNNNKKTLCVKLEAESK